MKRNVCEEKGGKVPEAKLGRCIRSKEKELLDKCDGLATAAGNETRPKSIYNIYMILQGCIRIHLGAAFLAYSKGGLSSAWNCPPRTEGVRLVAVV